MLPLVLRWGTKAMVKVIAQNVGYYGGKIREIGEGFEMADEHYLGGGDPPCGWVEAIGEVPKPKQEATRGGTPRAGKAEKPEQGR